MFNFKLNEDGYELLKQLSPESDYVGPDASTVEEPSNGTPQVPAANSQPASQAAEAQSQSAPMQQSGSPWNSNLDRLNALVGQQRGYDPALQSQHRDLEQQALTEAKDGGEYNIAKAVRDLAPMLLGSLLAGTQARDKGLALGNVAAASMGQIAGNTDRDMKVREAARQHALNEAAQRMSKGGTEFSQLAQAIQLQQGDQQLKNRMRELDQLAPKRDAEIAKLQQEIDRGEPKSEINKAARASLNANRAKRGLPPVADTITYEQALKDPNLDQETRLSFIDEVNRLEAQGAARTTTATVNARSQAEANNADRDANTAKIVAAGAAQGSKEGGRKGETSGLQAPAGFAFADESAFKQQMEDPAQRTRMYAVTSASHGMRQDSARLESLRQQYGTEVLPSKAKSEMEALKSHLIGSLAQLSGQGVVNPGERATWDTIMPGLANASDITGFLIGKDLTLEQLQGISKAVERITTSASDSYGLKYVGLEESKKSRPEKPTAPKPSTPKSNWRDVFNGGANQ